MQSVFVGGNSVLQRVIVLVLAITLGLLGSLPGASAADTVWLDELNITQTAQDWGKPHKNASVDGRKLKIAGQTYQRGLGTHAESTLALDLQGGSELFRAQVGADDEAVQRGSVEFRVIGDGKVLWSSGVMRTGDPAKKVAVKVKGIKILVLFVGDAGDGNSFDHADWVNARFELAAGGAKPVAREAPAEEAVILTPKPGPKPRINGARVFGVRPGHPFLYAIAATGARPMEFAARALPAGLTLDSKTGRITGTIKERGKYAVMLRARNAQGIAERPLTILCGDRIALTPPMGWNSWNCFAGAVSAKRSDPRPMPWSRAACAARLELHQHRRLLGKEPRLEGQIAWGPRRTAEGVIVPNPRFPDMKALADYVHGRGLKIGIYSSPGPFTCGGCLGSFDHEEQDARTYAGWGIDYLKYDWCSYDPKMEAKRRHKLDISEIMKAWGTSLPRQREEYIHPYAVMRTALDRVPRDIVFSLCQYGMGNVWEWGTEVGGNCWRTTGDISDSWGSMAGIGFAQAGHEKYAGPGHWNDPDMLVVGKVGWGNLHPTHLKPNEQYTHISLWCLLASPLLIGCDMTQFDDFTLNLLTNDEVLEVSQDPLGRQAGRVARKDGLEVWAKDMEDGSKAVGLFNRGEMETTVTAKWSDLKLSGKHLVRDLWRQKDLGVFEEEFSAKVPRHGVVLVRLWKAS